MMLLTFKCKKCNKEFDFDVGKISNFVNKRFRMGHEPACPFCGNAEDSDILLSDKNTPQLQEILNKEVRKMAIRAYKPGKLMSYAAIFGGSEVFSIQFKNENYKIADDYCAAPNCDCNEVSLYAFRSDSNLDSPSWSFVYDYQLDKLRECDDITEEDAQEIIKKIKAEDKDIFSKRHFELKKELRHPLHNKFFKNKKFPLRIGRNEPCPCGSGKKYKKCCLNKED